MKITLGFVLVYRYRWLKTDVTAQQENKANYRVVDYPAARAGGRLSVDTEFISRTHTGVHRSPAKT